MPEINNQLSVFFLVWQEMLERNFQTALERLESQPFEVFEFPTGVVPKEHLIGFIYARTGRPEDARRAFEAAAIALEKEAAERPDDARVHSWLGIVYAYLGQKEDAVREGQLGVELHPVSRDAMHGPEHVIWLAEIYAVIGDHEVALDKLEYVLSIPSGAYAPMLRIDPVWDPLRDHPRFQRLLEQHSKTDAVED